jgi:phospholipid/cholesterol/gamma-HCH transport system substrate-binding protein
MERKAHYALIGLVSILSFASLVVFIIWLAGAQVARRFDVYDVSFKGPVRGLSTGGEVFFNGIRIGEVTHLSLDRADPNKVMARIRVSSDAPVRTDSRAGLEPQGVTGVNYIQISAGLARSPLLKDVTARNTIPVILASPNALESLLQGGGDVLTRTVEVLDRTNRLMSDENISEIGATVRDIHAMSQEMRGQVRLAADADAAALGVRKAADALAQLSSRSTVLVDGDGHRALSSLADAAEELKGAAVDAHRLIRVMDAPAGELATTTLPQFNRTVTRLEVAADSLGRLTTQLQLDPAAVLAKAPAQTLKVKP